MQGLETLDWVVVAIYFLLIAALAIWVMSQKQNNTEEYFLAGRNLGWFIIGASIFASNIGSEHLVGLSGSGATDGVGVGARTAPELSEGGHPGEPAVPVELRA